MTQRRAIHVVATGARLLTGAAIAVACVAGVTAAVAVPWPVIATAPAQVAVTPAAGDTVLVCNGPFRALGRDVTNAQQMSAAGSPETTTASTGDDPEHSSLDTPDLLEASGASVLTGIADRGERSLIAASEAISLAEEDLDGLASAPCREASTESWLVGGAVTTGTNDLIILSNPGDVTATVTLTVYGTDQPPSNLLVPAGTQIAVPLAASAAGMQQPVVRVTAAGSPVRAVLQSSLVRTLDPAGIDLQDTAGTPQEELSFAGVQVVTGRADSASTVLRMLATDAATEATVTVRAAGEQTASHEVSVPLESGMPVEVSLPLDEGVYSVQVRGDAPLVGAVWQSTGTGGGTDFAWMTPAPEIAGDVLIAVPEAPSPRLHIVNRSETDATVTVTPTDAGTAQEITIPAGGSDTVRVAAGKAYTISSSEPIHAAVAFSAAHALAGWPVWPSASAEDPITVYP